jgi:hypothetical protein
LANSFQHAALWGTDAPSRFGHLCFGVAVFFAISFRASNPQISPGRSSSHFDSTLVFDLPNDWQSQSRHEPARNRPEAQTTDPRSAEPNHGPRSVHRRSCWSGTKEQDGNAFSRDGGAIAERSQSHYCNSFRKRYTPCPGQSQGSNYKELYGPLVSAAFNRMGCPHRVRSSSLGSRPQVFILSSWRQGILGFRQLRLSNQAIVSQSGHSLPLRHGRLLIERPAASD